MDTSQYSDGVVLTRKGYALIGKLLAAKTKLNYSGASVGNGIIPDEVDPRDLTELPGFVMDAAIVNVDAPGNGEAVVTAQIDSSGVTAGFHVTWVALYADDPDEGSVLYSFLDMREYPEWIRPEGKAIGKIATFDLITIVDSIKVVTAEISPAGMARMKDIPKVEMSNADSPAVGTKTHLKILQILSNWVAPIFGTPSGGKAAKTAAVVEYRVYDDPQNPETSNYKVGFPITSCGAVFNPETGESLSDILTALSDKITQLEENAGPGGGSGPGGGEPTDGGFRIDGKTLWNVGSFGTITQTDRSNTLEFNPGVAVMIGSVLNLGSTDAENVVDGALLNDDMEPVEGALLTEDGDVMKMAISFDS